MTSAVPFLTIPPLCENPDQLRWRGFHVAGTVQAPDQAIEGFLRLTGRAFQQKSRLANHAGFSILWVVR